MDTYDAITTMRPYRAALSTEHACDELFAAVRRNLLREDLVETFVAIGRSGELDAIVASVNVNSA